jgi:hypothetical protein
MRGASCSLISAAEGPPVPRSDHFDPIVRLCIDDPSDQVPTSGRNAQGINLYYLVTIAQGINAYYGKSDSQYG